MDEPANVFIFAPQCNSPPDAANPSGCDATGAFIPGASTFEKIWKNRGADVFKLLFNNKAGERARFDQILRSLDTASDYQLDCIAYFGHGTKDLLSSAKIGPGYMDEFAQHIRANSAIGVKIILYACSCGAPDGFAQKLAAKLSDLNAVVFGHLSAGHAFTNPQVRRFPGGSGIRVCPDGYVQGWIRALANTDLWARFPFMTTAEIQAELSAP